MARGLRLVAVLFGLVVATLAAAAVMNREEPSAALSAASSTTTAPVPAVESTTSTTPATTAPAPKPTTTTTRAVPSTTKAPAPATTARPATTTTRPAPAPGNTAADALAALNRDRAGRGLPALPVRADAQAKAQAWAEKLARDGTLSHSVLNQGLTQCWSGVGENVAMAPSVAQAEQLLMGHPPHRDNILAPRWTAVGVGVARANGAYFVVQVFVTGC